MMLIAIPVVVLTPRGEFFFRYVVPGLPRAVQSARNDFFA